MLPVHVHVLAMCVATILEICSLGPHSSMQPAYRPISQTPQSKCLIPHNTPFRTELCTFRFFIAHCWIWTNALWYLCNWSLGHFRLKIYVILLACVSSDSPNWQRKMCNWALVSNICNDSWLVKLRFNIWCLFCHRRYICKSCRYGTLTMVHSVASIKYRSFNCHIIIWFLHHRCVQ